MGRWGTHQDVNPPTVAPFPAGCFYDCKSCSYVSSSSHNNLYFATSGTAAGCTTTKPCLCLVEGLVLCPVRDGSAKNADQCVCGVESGVTCKAGWYCNEKLKQCSSNSNWLWYGLVNGRAPELGPDYGQNDECDVLDHPLDQTDPGYQNECKKAGQLLGIADSFGYYSTDRNQNCVVQESTYTTGPNAGVSIFQTYIMKTWCSADRPFLCGYDGQLCAVTDGSAENAGTCICGTSVCTSVSGFLCDSSKSLTSACFAPPTPSPTMFPTSEPTEYPTYSTLAPTTYPTPFAYPTNSPTAPTSVKTIGGGVVTVGGGAAGTSINAAYTSSPFATATAASTALTTGALLFFV